MLRIAMLLDNSFRPDPRVLREALALTQAGHRVTIYAWDRDMGLDRPAQERIEQVEVVRLPIKSKQQLGPRQIPRYLAYAWRVFWLVRRGSFDVVHCHDLPNLPVGVMLKAFKRIRLAYDAHEIYWIMEAHKYPGWILGLLRYGEMALLRWVDIFFTVGATRAQYYRPHYKRAIHVVGNWYDPQSPDLRQGQDLRRRLGISKDAFVLTWAGTLSPERAPELLIDCARRLWNEGRPIHWLVCGLGPSQSAFIQAAQQNPNLHYLGWVEDTTALYSASNALVYLMDLSHPYTRYNAPNNLYLSIAWALPLIGVAAGEIGATLTSGETGMLIDKMDVDTLCRAVVELSGQPELYERIVNNLRQLQPFYSWASAARCLRRAHEMMSE